MLFDFEPQESITQIQNIFPDKDTSSPLREAHHLSLWAPPGPSSGHMSQNLRGLSSMLHALP